jgi:hypothetical protein
MDLFAEIDSISAQDAIAHDTKDFTGGHFEKSAASL